MPSSSYLPSSIFLAMSELVPLSLKTIGLFNPTSLAAFKID
jgi:hypothetical protein